MFWTNVDECAIHDLRMLVDSDEAREIAQAGRKGIVELRLGNEDLGDEVLRFAGNGQAGVRAP